LVRRGGEFAAKDVELDFDAEESLENAVVEVAGDAAALAFDGAGAHVAQQEKIFERGGEMNDDAVEPVEIFAGKRSAAVENEKAAHGLAILFIGDGHERAEPELLLRGAGRARKSVQGAAVRPVPVGAAPGGS